MMAKATRRATIRGTSMRFLMSLEVLAREVVSGGGRVEVAAWKQVVKDVSIWRERNTNRRSNLLKLSDRRLAVVSAMDRVGRLMISEMVSRWRSRRVWGGPVGGWKEFLCY